MIIIFFVWVRQHMCKNVENFFLVPSFFLTRLNKQMHLYFRTASTRLFFHIQWQRGEEEVERTSRTSTALLQPPFPPFTRIRSLSFFLCCLLIGSVVVILAQSLHVRWLFLVGSLHQSRWKLIGVCPGRIPSFTLCSLVSGVLLPSHGR